MNRIYAVFIILSGFCCSFTFAGAISWSKEEYSLYAKNDSLREVVGELASSQGIPVEIEPSVDELISANFIKSNRSEIFKTLTKVYGLSWYYDGHILYIDKLKNNKSETIFLKKIRPEYFKKQLMDLGVYQDSGNVYWRAVNDKKIIYISGPPPFIKKIKALASKIDNSFGGSDIVYKWRDKRGRINYSTDPSLIPKNAELIEFPNYQKSSVDIYLSSKK